MKVKFLTRELRSRLGFLPFELVIISASILVAFALDSSWDRSKERKREKQYLSQLQHDFRATGRSARVVKELEDQIIDKAQQALVYIDMQQADSLKLVLPYLTRYHQFTPITGTYEAMIHSGEINLIQSDSLRAGIINYYGIMNHITEHIQRMNDWTIKLLDSPVAEEFFTSDIIQMERPKRPVIDYASLINDRSFDRFLVKISTAAVNRINYYSYLLIQIEKIRHELEKIQPMHFYEPDSLELSRYTGAYVIYDAVHIEVIQENGWLYAQVTGQPSLSLFPLSKSVFAYNAIEAEIHFHAEPGGKADRLTLHQEGHKIEAARIENAQ